MKLTKTTMKKLLSFLLAVTMLASMMLLTACRTTWGQQRLVSTAMLYDRLGEYTPITPILFKNGSVLTQWGRLTGLQPRQNNIFYALENWTLDQ